jgi:hypothetical protein
MLDGPKIGITAIHRISVRLSGIGVSRCWQLRYGRAAVFAWTPCRKLLAGRTPPGLTYVEG